MTIFCPCISLMTVFYLCVSLKMLPCTSASSLCEALCVSLCCMNSSDGVGTLGLPNQTPLCLE